MPVILEDPQRVNLLALILRDTLERALAAPGAAEALRPLDGALTLDAGGMQATVVFAPEGPRVRRGGPPAGAARTVAIRGTLPALVSVVLAGAGRTGAARLIALIRAGALPFVAGDIRIEGSLTLLYAAMPLLVA